MGQIMTEHGEKSNRKGQGCGYAFQPHTMPILHKTQVKIFWVNANKTGCGA